MSGIEEIGSTVQKHWPIVLGVIGVGGLVVWWRMSSGSSSTTSSAVAPSVSGLSAAPPTVNITLPNQPASPVTLPKATTGKTAPKKTAPVSKPASVNLWQVKASNFNALAAHHVTFFEAGSHGGYVAVSNKNASNALKRGAKVFRAPVSGNLLTPPAVKKTVVKKTTPHPVAHPKRPVSLKKG